MCQGRDEKTQRKESIGEKERCWITFGLSGLGDQTMSLRSRRYSSHQVHRDTEVSTTASKLSHQLYTVRFTSVDPRSYAQIKVRRVYSHSANKFYNIQDIIISTKWSFHVGGI